MKKKILIISDRFKNSGNGNYLRSYSLCKFLKKYFLSKIILFHELKKISVNKYNVIILDLPYKNYNLNSLKKFDGTIISLDHHLKFTVDLNISLFGKSNYAKKNLCSLKYTIIRDEIKKNNKKNLNSDLLLISLGSSDIKNLRYKVFNIIKTKYQNIFLAKAFNHQSQIEKITNKKFIQKMKECALGITNGGTTMLELIYLKKIIISLPQTILEKNFTYFVKKKYKVYTGLKMLKNNMIKKIIKQKQVKGPIDGNGCQHILHQIKKIISNVK